MITSRSRVITWMTARVLYFDAETGLPALYQYANKIDGRRVAVEHRWSDWREGEGLRCAVRTLVLRDGKQFFSGTNLSFHFLERVAAEYFQRP